MVRTDQRSIPERIGAVTVTAVLLLSVVSFGGLSGGIAAQEGPAEGPLTTDVQPGDAGVENDFTFAFNASEISDERSVLDIRINFSEVSGVDASAIAEDDVTIEGEDTGTPSVDATAEAAPGVLVVTSSDTFTLDNEGGVLTVNVSGVEVSNEGTFDSEVEFLDDEEGDVIAFGSDQYEIGEGSQNPAAFDVQITDTNSPVTAGEPVTVDAEIQNTGDVSATQTIDLTVDGLGSDDVTVSLDGGQSTTETLSVETAEGDAGTYTATVASVDASASTTVEVQAGTTEGPLTTEVSPGETGVENTFTFAFNASEISDERSVLDIRIDFDEASGVDAAAIPEDDVTIEGESTGTPGVDATAEAESGVLVVTSSDTFTLDNEDGLVTVTISGVEVGADGSFASEIEFLDDEEGDVIAFGTDGYPIDEGESGDGPPPVVGDDPPQDLNGDGLYRDIDGDDEFTIGDVQLFFRNRNSAVVQSNAAAFNFDSEATVEVTISDVQALFLDSLDSE